MEISNTTVRIIPVILLLLAGCAGLRLNRSFSSSAIDWTMYGGVPERTNHSLSVVQPPFEPIWEYNANGGIAGSPLIRDSVLIVGTLHGELQAVNLPNGKRLGYVVLESSVTGTPVWDGTTVFVPISSTSESFVALGLRRAEKYWSLQLGPIESAPLLLNDRLYVTSLNGVLYCLKKSDGSEEWKFATASKERSKPVRSSPATDGERIFFGGDDGAVYAVDKNDGMLKWKYQTRGSVFATPILSSGSVIVGSLDGRLYSLNTSDGSVRWKFDAQAPIYGSASASPSMVFFGSADGVCHALDLQSGRERWKFSTRSVLNSAPLISGSLLYVGSMDRNLYVVKSETGEKVWQFEAPGRIRVSPVIWGSTLLVTSEDKYITALKPTGVE